jgi:hypothetical protein
MRGKLLSVLWLAVVASGCERRAGSSADGSATTLTPASDTTAGQPVTGKPQILGVTVQVRTTDGKVRNLAVNLDRKEGSDALFLSQQAVENFVVPFYTGRKGEGADSAASILKEAKAQFEALGFIIILHKLKCKVLIPRDLEQGELSRRL